MQTASPRRAPKAPPKKPGARKKGPVKRPEWNLCFDNTEGDVGESSSATQTPIGVDPGEDNPNGDKPSKDEAGRADSGGRTSDGAELNAANPGRDNPGANHGRAVGGGESSRNSGGNELSSSPKGKEATHGPDRCLPSGSGAGKRSAGVLPGTSSRAGGASCGADQPGGSLRQRDGEPGYEEPGYVEAGYGGPGHREPGYEEPGYIEPGYGKPGYGEPGYEELGASTSGEQRAGESASERTDRGNGGAGQSATGSGVPGSATDRMAQIDRKGKGKVEDEPSGNHPDAAKVSENVVDRKGKAKVEERASNGSKPSGGSLLNPTENSASGGDLENGRHNDAVPPGKVAPPEMGSTAADVPTVIFGPILTSLPPTLKKLALSDCGLGDVHVAQVVRGLTSAGCALRELDLSQNEVSARGASAVFVWLQVGFFSKGVRPSFVPSGFRSVSFQNRPRRVVTLNTKTDTQRSGDTWRFE